MKQWSWKAILGGLFIDIAGGLLLGLLIGCLFFLQAAQNFRMDQHSVPTTPLLILSCVAWLSMDMLCGYLTATWAPTRKIPHALVMGCASLAVGILFRTSDQAGYPSWFALSSVLVIPAAVLGGWWRVKTHGPETQPQLDNSSSTAPIFSPFND